MYSKWHDESESSFLEDACGKILRPYGISELNYELQNRSLLETKDEAIKSLDDFITPKSIIDKDFPDYEELDLMRTSVLKRYYDKQTHFRKKISVEEQRAQKDNRFLRGRQITYLIYEYFRPTGSDDEIQGLLKWISIKLENDDIQDFDLRWEQVLLLTSDPPSDKVTEGLYVSELQYFLKLKYLCHYIFKKICEEEEKKNEII